jgi:hypothetical protein
MNRLREEQRPRAVCVESRTRISLGQETGGIPQPLQANTGRVLPLLTDLLNYSVQTSAVRWSPSFVATR